jgi:outer membrane protein TolC
LSAEAEVATREADILQAEAMVKNSEDRLKTTINIAAHEEDVGVEIIPASKPKYEKREISLEEALVTALENRPDLQVTRIDLKNKEINLSYAKNQLLPDLSLNASYWSPGLSGTQIRYDPLDPFGDPISTDPGTSSDAMRDALKFRYKNWAVRLSLTIPFNSFIYRAQHARAKVNLEQMVLQLKDQEQQLFLEIKEAVRAVQTDYKRVQAYKLARELAEEKLDAEQKKLKVGLSTNYVVLQQQRDLSNAQSSELRAIIDYNLSLANLDRTMGTSLKKKNIRLSNILEKN